MLVREIDGRAHHSLLKLHAQSPAHVLHRARNPLEPSRAVIVGAVADRMIMGNRGWAVFDGRTRQGKEWEAFKLAHPGETICNRSEYDDAKGCADAVLSDPVARALLDPERCEFQQVMQWDAYGLPCAAGIQGQRGGFDALCLRPKSVSRPYIADMKCTADADPETLSKHAIKMYWHSQAAFYLDGARELGIGVSEFYLVCVESSAPHPVTVLRVPETALDLGRRSLQRWSDRHRACEDAGVWPGYVQAIVDLEVPEWLEAVVS